MEIKKCTNCAKFYPKSIEFFNMSDKSNDGLTLSCARCLDWNTANKKRKAKKENERVHETWLNGHAELYCG
jgi:hypothetical protein